MAYRGWNCDKVCLFVTAVRSEYGIFSSRRIKRSGWLIIGTYKLEFFFKFYCDVHHSTSRYEDAKLNIRVSSNALYSLVPS